MVEHAGEPGPFLGQEAGVLLVGAPVREIDLAVRDVPVAADDDVAAALRELVQLRDDAFHEAELDREPLLGARAGRQVEGHDGELAEVGLQVAAFGVDVENAKPLDDPIGFAAAVEAHAAVPFLLGVMEPALQAGGSAHGVGEIRGLRLQFLQAHDIGILPFEPGEEALGHRRADAVHIDGDDAQHG